MSRVAVNSLAIAFFMRITLCSSCTDIPPPHRNESCPQLKSSGACEHDWLTGYCQVICGTCSSANKLQRALSCMKSGGVETMQDSQGLLWNRLIRTQPLAVVRPVSVEQVETTVVCASGSNFKVVPRSGGHSYVGASVLDDAITIDLRELNNIEVATDSSQVTVGAGARLGELYYKVSEETGGRFGVVGGVCPGVGVGGLVSGGGVGHLSRARGLACDQLVKLQMVLPDGSTVTASLDENRDLFWAACGGGGALLGIVTQFTLRTVPLPAEGVTTFTLTVPTDRAADFFERFVFFNSESATAAGQGYDNNLYMKAVISSSNGKPYVTVKGAYLGPASEVPEKLRASGLGDGRKWGFDVDEIDAIQEPWLLGVIRTGYLSTIKSPSDLVKVDKWSEERVFFKYKSALLMPETSLPSKAFYDDLIAWVGKAGQQGTPASAHVELLRGKIAERDADATAFAHRAALGVLQYGASWGDGSDTAKNLEIISDIQTLLESRYLTFPHYAKYVNYVDLQQPSSQGYFGSALQRLQELKGRYDPNNLIANPVSY